jgi:hypothetical protein
MAQEIKNTFLKSKMNKDLDDRILPNGEYRDALNISVGRSEDNDVGALENIIGNTLVTGTDIGIGLTVIGIYAENSSDSLFVFLTNYTDPNPLTPTNAPIGSKHYIYLYNQSSNTYRKLIQGEFLNFSKTNRIVGINLIENLLFWTDNRSQPRKININLARAFDSGGLATVSGDYYTEEHQISVAKYSPYNPINLYNRVNLTAESGATTDYFEIEGNREVELKEAGYIGATVVCTETVPPTQGTAYVQVTNIKNLPGPVTRITVSPQMSLAPVNRDIVSLITSTMTNKNDDPLWPGDPDYLEDKFVRFSYRFKFDDNEYSLMAPFTQIAYIPKQKGFFINGDEDAAYRSTIVRFMENMVQNIGLVVPLPSSANRLRSKYKIAELELLFRESDGVAVKVLDTVTVNDISGDSGIDSYYTYEYQSRKPYRTLPEAQTVRVYDKVPVRALTQESAGNRIIYGNFVDQYTPPPHLNYNCRIARKSSSGAYNNWIEYPNHSLKRNRNYQVGFVLADKFGRQSPVILSSVGSAVTQNNGVFYSGSTIYSPYDADERDTDVDTWFGDAIQVLVNSPISVDLDTSAGTPGLYAEKTQRDSSGEGFAITDGFAQSGGNPITGTTFTFTLDDAPAEYPNNANIPDVGDYMRGAYQDFVKVTARTNTAGSTWVITTEGRVNDIYLRDLNIPSTSPDLKFAYTINDLGWYSYRIVVKQTEQDYYNVYLPGILNGYPGQSGNEQHSNLGGIDEGIFPNETNLTAHTVLFNDNINKIPRDLVEVGPDQKQYRSSITLYGRVTNEVSGVNQGQYDPGIPVNKQYYPRLQSQGKNAITHTSTAIANARDFNMGFSDLSGDVVNENTGGANGVKVFYEISSNPLIARISTTEKAIGWTNTNPQPLGDDLGLSSYNMRPFLAVYETQANESLLDIYWETSTSGLITDLNSDVASTNTGIVGFDQINWEFDEGTSPGDAVTSWFSPINNEGQIYLGVVETEYLSAVNAEGDDADIFELAQGIAGTPNAGQFQIRYTPPNANIYPVFTADSFEKDVYSFQITLESGDETFVIPLQGVQGGFGSLRNLRPEVGTMINIVKSPSDRVLITTDQINNADARNGNGSTDPDQYKPGLQYYLIKNPNFQNANALPTGWYMDGGTGELQQNTSGNYSNGYDPGNPLAVYQCRLVVVDVDGPASAPGDANGYGPLSTFDDFTITLNPAEVNAGAKTPIGQCVVDPGFPGYGGLQGEPTAIYQSNFDYNMISQSGFDKALPGGIFGHHIVDAPYNRLLGDENSNCFLQAPYTSIGEGEVTRFMAPDTDAGNSTSGCIYYIGNGNPLLSVAGANNSILGTGKWPDNNPPALLTDGSFPAFPVFYSRIGTQSHMGGSIVFTVNTYAPARGGLVEPNVVKIPYTRFYYRQPTEGNDNPNWIELTRSIELNQIGNSSISAPFNDAFSINDGKFDARTRFVVNPSADEGDQIVLTTLANITQGRTVTTQPVGGNDLSSWMQAVRAFSFDQLYDPDISGASISHGIEYAIVCTNQKQYNITNAEEGLNNGIMRSWVVADDLNYPQCAVWQNRNLVNQLEAGKELFPYYVQQNGGSSASEWKSTIGGPGTGVGTFYARSPYIDYVDHLYTDETNGILFTPSSEAEQRINFRQDRTLLVGPNPANPIYTFPYSNSPKTTFQGVYPADQELASLDLQFNAAFGWSGSGFPGRKLINPNSTQGVGAVRVFNETNPIPNSPATLEELNIDQSYPVTGTLRLKLN